MSWGTQAQTKEAKTTKTVEPTTRFDEAYYRELFTNNSMNAVTHRCAFVGHENTAKTGLALSLLDKEINEGKTIYIFDVDNSAKSTVDYVYPDKDNIVVLPLHDETDESIFDEDNNVDYNDEDTKEQLMRKGNIRARLRMMTLYNWASKLGGCVASTDNFSELAAGFWTLHGDVGDVAPIQSLSKSWEVPALAEQMDVPASIISATPTDGLGVDAGDEAQFGFSYLQFDLVLFGLLSELETELRPSDDDLAIVDNVKTRIMSTGYKRVNPVNLNHPVRGNELYSALQNLDDKLLKGE